MQKKTGRCPVITLLLLYNYCLVRAFRQVHPDCLLHIGHQYIESEQIYITHLIYHSQYQHAAKLAPSSPSTNGLLLAKP